ncbi:MAG: cell division protein CrgA [Candidatus Nanopelagicales bacterium]
MPESRVRRKKVFTPEPTPRSEKPVKFGSPRWWAPLMVGLMVFGLAWIVVYYIAGADLPVMKDLAWVNILIGFGFIFAGFGMATRWR